MNITDDFKSIRRKLERQEQTAEHNEKKPPAPLWFEKPVVWTPEGGNAGPR